MLILELFHTCSMKNLNVKMVGTFKLQNEIGTNKSKPNETKQKSKLNIETKRNQSRQKVMMICLVQNY